jgi:hypothetical protein
VTEIVLLKSPIPSDDILRITALLSKADIFTAAFTADPTILYDPTQFLIEQVRSGTQTQLLADRNIVTDWIALGEGAPAGSSHRIAAAVMAFAQCGEILIESNTALYELAASAGNQKPQSELRLFRLLNNLAPSHWFDVALARQERLPLSDICNLPPREENIFDFEMPLRSWRRNYVIVLRIGYLALKKGVSRQKIEDLMDWMYRDFLFSGPALAMAMRYFAPNARKQGLFKNLESPDRERTILGAKNAAWDLTLLHQWLKMIERQNSENLLTILASCDSMLHEIARALACEETPNMRDPLEKYLFSLWGDQKGKRIFESYSQLIKDAKNPKRALNQGPGPNVINDLISQGEALLRNWTPQT